MCSWWSAILCIRHPMDKSTIVRNHSGTNDFWNFNWWNMYPLAGVVWWCWSMPCVRQQLHEQVYIFVLCIHFWYEFKETLFIFRYMLALALIGKVCSIVFFFGAWWCYIPPKQVDANKSETSTQQIVLNGSSLNSVQSAETERY